LITIVESRYKSDQQHALRRRVYCKLYQAPQVIAAEAPEAFVHDKQINFSSKLKHRISIGNISNPRCLLALENRSLKQSNHIKKLQKNEMGIEVSANELVAQKTSRFPRNRFRSPGTFRLLLYNLCKQNPPSDSDSTVSGND
ncbi:hypothetical protein CSKR_104894, partial [Clonorchis sinensis]